MKQTGITPTGDKIAVELPEVNRPGCINCAFAIVVMDGPNNVASVECRRYAPRPGQIAAWPTVRPDDWCGMHTSREEFAANEVARKQALGAAALLRDLFDPSKTPPDNLNG